MLARARWPPRGHGMQRSDAAHNGRRKGNTWTDDDAASGRPVSTRSAVAVVLTLCSWSSQASHTRSRAWDGAASTSTSPSRASCSRWWGASWPRGCRRTRSDGCSSPAGLAGPWPRWPTPMSRPPTPRASRDRGTWPHPPPADRCGSHRSWWCRCCCCTFRRAGCARGAGGSRRAWARRGRCLCWSRWHSRACIGCAPVTTRRRAVSPGHVRRGHGGRHLATSSPRLTLRRPDGSCSGTVEEVVDLGHVDAGERPHRQRCQHMAV